MNKKEISDMKKLKKMCNAFVKNIDRWIKEDDRDSINTATVNLKESIPQVMDEL